MKSLCLSLLALVFGQFVQADTLDCRLESGRKSARATLDLKSLTQDYVTSGGVYDLSFSLNAECTGSKCKGYIFIDSVQLEDEAGSLGFEFERSAQKSTVLNEPVENAPDKRKYKLSCEYAP